MVAVDTSVLVAALLARHEHHTISAAELGELAVAGRSLCLPYHALLESYSVLTRLPPPHRLGSQDAWRALHGSFASWSVAGPPATAWDFLERTASAGVVGGALYDALIVESALAAGARELVTWNVSDFDRLAGGRMVVRPPRTPPDARDETR